MFFQTHFYMLPLKPAFPVWTGSPKKNHKMNNSPCRDLSIDTLHDQIGLTAIDFRFCDVISGPNRKLKKKLRVQLIPLAETFP